MNDLFDFRGKTILLDGSMGRELRVRGVETPSTIWSANALLVSPRTVLEIHLDNIAAGADIITTNTYGIIKRGLAEEGIADRFVELNQLACELARRARDQSKIDVLIAGSLPPLRGSYRPDLVGPVSEIQPLYAEQAEILANYVDLLICETMSTADEALAAATAACETGKPVWMSWTLHDRQMGVLRSRETVTQAWNRISHLPIDTCLFNCCPPESIEVGLPELAGLGLKRIGAYANTFVPIAEDWTLGGSREEDGLIIVRDDLDVESYAQHAAVWLQQGAGIIGGCCGTGPEYIARLRTLIDHHGA